MHRSFFNLQKCTTRRVDFFCKIGLRDKIGVIRFVLHEGAYRGGAWAGQGMGQSQFVKRGVVMISRS